MRLSGKIAAITGGGGGIGKAAAQTFAKEGAVVLILEKDETLDVYKRQALFWEYRFRLY